MLYNNWCYNVCTQLSRYCFREALSWSSIALPRKCSRAVKTEATRIVCPVFIRCAPIARISVGKLLFAYVSIWHQTRKSRHIQPASPSFCSSSIASANKRNFESWSSGMPLQSLCWEWQTSWPQTEAGSDQRKAQLSVCKKTIRSVLLLMLQGTTLAHILLPTSNFTCWS